MKTFIAYCITKGDIAVLVTVQAERRPSWGQMARIVPGFVTAELVMQF